MDKTVILRLLEDLKGFLPGDIAAILLRLHHIISHIPHCHAPALRVIPAALVMMQTGTPAGAGACRIFPLVLGKPVRNMLQIDRFTFHFNGLFHRDHMHTDPIATLPYKGGHMLQRQP